MKKYLLILFLFSVSNAQYKSVYIMYKTTDSSMYVVPSFMDSVLTPYSQGELTYLLGLKANSTALGIKVDSTKTAYRSIVLSAVGGLRGTAAAEALPNVVSTTYVNSVPIRTVGFPYDSTRYLTWQVYMPTNFDSTGGMTYKVYSLSDTLQVDTIYWKLEAVALNSADTLTPAFGTAVQVIQINQTSTSATTVRSYQSPESGVIRASGSSSPGCTMIFRLQRVKSTNYTRPQLLWYVRVSYKINNYSDR